MRSCHLYLFGCFVFSAHAWSAGLSDMLECSDIEIEAEINSELSRQENLERLHQQFDEAVNAVSHCDPTANGGGGGGGGGSAGGGSTSKAAEGISGTEVKPSSMKQDVKGSQAASSSGNGSPVATEKKANEQGSNGKKPDELNANDNDSIYAQQLKAAADNEKDPAVKEQLLKEYRKFKSIIGK